MLWTCDSCGCMGIAAPLIQCPQCGAPREEENDVAKITIAGPSDERAQLGEQAPPEAAEPEPQAAPEQSEPEPAEPHEDEQPPAEPPVTPPVPEPAQAVSEPPPPAADLGVSPEELARRLETLAPSPPNVVSYQAPGNPQGA